MQSLRRLLRLDKLQEMRTNASQRVLELEAINPARVDGFVSGLAVMARWQVTCGFCRTRFEGDVMETWVGSALSWVACPSCGTRNLLPHHPSIRSREISGR